MKRAINTIPRDEYYKLLSKAASKMYKKICRLIYEEESMQMACENKEEYEKAEMHDFNARALLIALEAITKSPNQFRNDVANEKGNTAGSGFSIMGYC